MLLLVLLGVGFTSLLVGQVLKVGDFSPHLGTLNLNSFDITLKLSKLSTEVSVLVSLGNTLVLEATGFKALLIEHSSSTSRFFGKINSLLGFISEQELEVLELLASFTDLISRVVESITVFVFTTGSVVS